jgi:hypothetical protein
LAIADDVLRNDASPSALDAHVAQLDRLYRRLASADRADSAALALQ